MRNNVNEEIKDFWSIYGQPISVIVGGFAGRFASLIFERIRMIDILRVASPLLSKYRIPISKISEAIVPAEAFHDITDVLSRGRQKLFLKRDRLFSSIVPDSCLGS